MYDKPFSLQIITPTGIAFQGEALSVTAPGVQGGFQVLYNHAPLLSSLAIGEIRVTNRKREQFLYAVSGGFLEVKNNLVVALVDAIEHAPDIDVSRATRARERAETRMHSKDPSVDIDRARLAMVRALNRLRVAAKN